MASGTTSVPQASAAVSRLKRILSGRRFTQFLIGLVIVYLVVWLEVFHRNNKELDDDSEVTGIQLCDCDLLKKLKEQIQESEPQEAAEQTDTARWTHYTKTPFVGGHQKMVLVLAYQRVGSSFFGQLFDKNPDVSYVYEPLDSLYTAMYGTTSGLNVPSDITSFKNGTDRIVPKDEISAVSTFLWDMLSCDFNQLPPEYFVHKYWSFLDEFMPSWAPYLGCLRNHSVVSARSSCAKGIKCPKRFGQYLWQSDKCKEHLWHSDTSTKDKHPNPFSKYKSCMSDVMTRAKPCVQLMTQKCVSARLTATKTVRATMDSVTSLREKNANLRVIHLFRDPRPVVVSRLSTISYNGLYARNSTVREAKPYCSIVARDLRKRRELEDLYPGTFFEVVYEDLVQHPAEYARAVYDFLGEDIPESLSGWVRNHTRGTQGRTKGAPKWKRALTISDEEDIFSACRRFFGLVDYNFPRYDASVH